MNTDALRIVLTRYIQSNRYLASCMKLTIAFLFLDPITSIFYYFFGWDLFRYFWSCSGFLFWFGVMLAFAAGRFSILCVAFLAQGLPRLMDVFIMFELDSLIYIGCCVFLAFLAFRASRNRAQIGQSESACVFCGYPLRQDDHFCTNCGTHRQTADGEVSQHGHTVTTIH